MAQAVRKATLHSILDIFQFVAHACLNLFKNFTFHSGYIPIMTELEAWGIVNTLHSILDIFQL